MLPRDQVPRSVKDHLSMKRLAALMLPIALAGLLVLAGCGKSPQANSGSTSGTSTGGGCPTTTTVDLGATTFVQSCVTLSPGATLTFNDPTSSGGVHIICLGNQQKCNASAQGPSVLQGQGFEIQPGQTKTATFSTAGTYQVTCTVHPNMNLSVKVQ